MLILSMALATKTHSPSRSLKLTLVMLAHGVVAELFAPRWFVALFAPTLPIQTTLRVWDAFCLDGLAAIHRVGLALLRIVEGPLLACDSQAAILITMQREHARCHDVDRLFQLEHIYWYPTS